MANRSIQWLAAAALACAAPTLHAQAILTDTDRMHALIDALDAPSHETRRDAEQALRDLPDLTLRQVLDRLIDGELSAEQRARLEEVGENLFLRRPRAGLGVSFDPRVPVGIDGVRIGRTEKGFPCAEPGGLLANDVLLEANGVMLLQQDDLRASILACEAGDAMTFRVLREILPADLDEVVEQLDEPPAGEISPKLEELTITVNTMAYADLRQPASPSAALLERAWRIRLASEGLRTASISLGPDAFSQSEGAAGDSPLQGVGVAAGGDARLARVAQRITQQRAGIQRLEPAPVVRINNLEFLKTQGNQYEGQRRQLTGERARLKASIGRINELPQADRNAIMARVQRLDTEIEQLTDLINLNKRQQALFEDPPR